ncbi:MAG: 2-hydroxyacid dehydrogenase [Thioalkalispiraceae bacterium]|jgi:glycerate dehydrogenase
MQGVFLDRKSLDLNDLDFSALEQVLEQWQYFDESHEHDVAERIADAQVVISNKVVLSRDILAKARNLELVCIAATGTNNIDLDAARENNVQVCNVRAYGTASVVEHVFAMLLALVRNLPAYQHAVAQGQWQKSKQFCMMDFPIGELTGKVMGIVGYGELGKAVAGVAKAFGMTVKIAQRPGGAAQPGRIPLAELLPELDVLSLHCPLTPETSNLITEKELAVMKPGAIVINAARGGIINEQDLAKALLQKKLGGACVDVLQTEPPQQGNPLLDNNIPNLILTPHMAWASRESRQRLLNQIAENIQSYQAGKLNNRVV